MPLFLLQHTHSAENCPRKNPEVLRQLASHFTASNAGKHGVKMLADWVNAPEHTIVLVLETDVAEKAMKFALPLLDVGSLTIQMGATLEEVARESGGQ
ncbi:MAG: hypothetical protein HY647_01230 [Acidobacteria bacterium]|nr:hypothetical protein [Acidobacteriota bacterium]